MPFELPESTPRTLHLISMADNNPLVLIIEDELSIRRFLRATLTSHGFQIVEAVSGQAGLKEAIGQPPDLVLLDLGLPDIDGLEVTQRLREWSKVPIIVLSARNQEHDKIAALDAGADDYLTKPFGVGELMARIRVARRHAEQLGRPDDPIFTTGELCVDRSRRQVFVAGAEVHLTPIEYQLLATLVRYAGKVVTQRQLLREVWGSAYEQEAQYLRTYMTHLRHKLEADPAHPRYLTTEVGVGYRLRVD
jgi:two-component system KDP operon response regulator KdpE